MKYYEHPAYVGLAAELPLDDDRHPEYERQFNEQGFDDSVTWSLDYSLLVWLTPRLKRYRELAFQTIHSPELEKAVDEMIECFEFALEDENYFSFNSEDQKKIGRGFELYFKYHRGLWW